MARSKIKRIREAAMALEAMPTKERLERSGGGFVIGGDKRTGKVFRMCDSSLEKIYAEKHISDLQHEMLRKLYQHWYLGQLAGMPKSLDLNRIVVEWSGNAGNEREMMHRNLFEIGWNEFDKVERHIVNIVVLMEAPLAVAGAALGYRSNYRGRLAAAEMLRNAADKLVKVWRI